MTAHTIEARFQLTAAMDAARERGRRIDERAIAMLADTIAGPQGVDNGALILARAIYKAAFALPHIMKIAIEKEEQDGKEERHGAE